mgnify:CR=1 FL=1
MRIFNEGKESNQKKPGKGGYLLGFLNCLPYPENKNKASEMPEALAYFILFSPLMALLNPNSVPFSIRG